MFVQGDQCSLFKYFIELKGVQNIQIFYLYNLLMCHALLSTGVNVSCAMSTADPLV
jgi:hypothetical protein